jgi:hypothetical protein
VKVARRSFVIPVTVLLLSAGCGGGDSGQPTLSESVSTTVVTSGSQAPLTETEDERNSGQDESANSAASGSVVVDGQSFAVEQMYRCEPYDGPGAHPTPDDLDLVAFGANSTYLSLTVSHDEGVNMGNGARYPRQVFDLRLDVVTSEGQVEYELGATNDENGNWSLSDADGTQLDGAPFTLAGDHIGGGMTLVETYPDENASTVAVSFDLEIPGNIQDCSS